MMTWLGTSFLVLWLPLVLCEDSSTTLPSSCISLEDGEHFIQPMDAEKFAKIKGTDEPNGPIRVRCSNGYTILDPSLDSNILTYFSTYHAYHTTFAGPDLDEAISWRLWWLPTRRDKNAKFMVSEDCINVDTDNSDIQVYGEETAYYMTGDSFGCNWPTKAMCDFDSETLECYQCSTNSDTAVKTNFDAGDPSAITGLTTNEVYYGKCGHMPLQASERGASKHSSCTEDTGSFLPSIGTTGLYCVAYQLSGSSDEEIESDVSLIDYGLEAVEASLEAEFYADSVVTVYLDQEDFLHGTYRITRPGTYIITEDIEFDFNSGELLDPNVEGSWFPLDSQAEDYPGAGEWDGHYWLGFFAGITIETDNVELDLNGHSIGMSQAFYFQQRFFSCIELNNKIFLDGEGPTWTGVDITYASNVVIKDGTVGLTSHIGIHGNKVTNLKIENVHIRDFETHGLGINEYKDLSVLDVEIGPSIDGQLGLSGNYNLARLTLPIFRAAAEEAASQTMEFKDRDPVTFDLIVDKLAKHMNMAFKYAYFGEESDANEEYDLAMKTFYNDWGISRAGTIYGALLRPRGASVFSYGKDSGTGYSSNLKIKGLHIHDIKLCMEEVIALGISRNSWMRDVFNAPLNLEAFTSNEFNELSETRYVGNAYLDAVFALKHFSSSWWYLGRLAIVQPFSKWTRVVGDESEEVDILSDIEHDVYLHCNFDTLGHVPKGVVGLRLEFTSNVDISDLTIENLYSFSPLGSEKCGPYKSGSDGGMPLQTQATNPGFGGTQVRAINMYGVSDMIADNVQIKNLMSLNGPVYGIHGSPNKGISSNVQFKNTQFEGLYSGIDLSLNELDWSQDNWPNPKAAACAIEEHIGIAFDKDTTSASCIYGHVGCDNCPSDGMCSKVGKYNDECDNLLDVVAKDLRYVVEPDGSIATEAAQNEYKDAVSRLGKSALQTVSEKTGESAIQDDTDNIKSIKTQSKKKTIQVEEREKMTTIKFVNNAKLNKQLSDSNSRSSSSSSSSSSIGETFLYGSMLFVMLVCVILSKQLVPRYRSRRANHQTFVTKLKYGKYGERFEQEMKEKQEKEEDLNARSEELIRLVNNSIGNGNDDEYTRLD